MAQEFHRNQNPSERVAKLNCLVDRADAVESRVDDLEDGGTGAGGAAPDPGDLRLYYENGKAGS